MAKDDTLFRRCDLARGDERITAWIPSNLSLLGAEIFFVPKRMGAKEAPFVITAVTTVTATGEALRASKKLRVGGGIVPPGDMTQFRWKP